MHDKQSVVNVTLYTRKDWIINKQGDKRIVWQWNERYRVKGGLACDNKYIDDVVLNEAFIWLIDNKEDNIKRWESLKDDEDLFISYKAK